jgi:protocatechuate 3,4-dioxygenase, alpha subunit
MRLIATPSQTVGPFFSIGLEPLKTENLAAANVSGEHITIAGRVLDGDGNPVPDAMLEIWQANARGKYAHPADTQHKAAEDTFSGYGRVPTNDSGAFRFTTVKPGAVPGPNGKMQAPHLVISVFMRGLLNRLVTRIYFPHEAANEHDSVLGLIEPARRATLIARKTKTPGVLEWNVILQDADETVFFDC